MEHGRSHEHQPTSHRWLCAGAWTAGFALAAAMVTAMLGTSPWYDEFFTLWVTRAGQPVLDQLGNHWLADNHPPLFYALARATAWLGTEAEPRRLLNLLFAAGAIAALFALARRFGNGRAIAAITALVLAGNVDVLEKAAELRSTFLTIAAATIAIVALLVLAAPGRRSARPARDLAVLSGALMLAANVHLVTSVIAGAIAGAFACWLALSRDWVGVRRLVLAGLIAAVPLMVTTALQLGGIEANTRSFWLTGGFDVGRWEIEKAVMSGLSGNWVITLAGIAGLGLLAAEAVRLRQIGQPLGTVLTIGAGCALALALLLVLHWWRPILLARYLLALVPAIAVVLAIGTATLLGRIGPKAGALFAAVASAATLLSIHGNLDATLHRPGWYDTARAIAAMKRACPGTVVHADLHWNRPVIALPPPDNAFAVPYGYHLVARHFDFGIEPLGSRRIAPVCPTVFWAEHVSSVSPTAEELAMRLKASGFAVGNVRLLRPSRGWILVSSPR